MRMSLLESHVFNIANSLNKELLDYVLGQCHDQIAYDDLKDPGTITRFYIRYLIEVYADQKDNDPAAMDNLLDSIQTKIQLMKGE